MEVAARRRRSSSASFVTLDFCLSRYSHHFSRNDSTAIDRRPESPRFLIKKENYKKAYESLCHLNETPLQAARELYYIHAQVQAENQLYFGSPTDSENRRQSPSSSCSVPNQASVPAIQPRKANTGFWRRVRQLFAVPRIRRALFAAFVVQISQQLCGVNIIGRCPD